MAKAKKEVVAKVEDASAQTTMDNPVEVTAPEDNVSTVIESPMAEDTNTAPEATVQVDATTVEVTAPPEESGDAQTNIDESTTETTTVQYEVGDGYGSTSSKIRRFANDADEQDSITGLDETVEELASEHKYTPEVPTTKYVPVVDSVSSGNVIGFFTVDDVAEFVSSARLMMNGDKLGTGLDNEDNQVMGVFGTSVVMGNKVLVIEAQTAEQAQALNSDRNFARLSTDDGYKYGSMLMGWSS